MLPERKGIFMNRKKIEAFIEMSKTILENINPTHLKYNSLSSLREKFLLLPEIEDVDVSWIDPLLEQLEYVISQHCSVESLCRLVIPSSLPGLDHKLAFTISGDYCINA